MHPTTTETNPVDPKLRLWAATAILAAALAGLSCDQADRVLEGTSVEGGSAQPGSAVDRPGRTADPEDDGPVARHLSPGERAFSVVVDEARAVGGYLRAGDAVDVSVVAPAHRAESPDDTADEPVVTPLLQNATLLEAEPLSRSGDEFRLTFPLPPDEVEVLEVADRTGQLVVSLRHPGDMEVVSRSARPLTEAVDNIDEIHQSRRDRFENMLFDCAPQLRPSCPGEGSEKATGRYDTKIRPSGSRLPTQIPANKRALSVPVRAPTAQAAPTTGDRVDLIGLFETDRLPALVEAGDGLSVDLLQQVEVLAAKPARGRDEQKLLTVSVTPEERRLLVLAQSAGRLEALVRPDGTIKKPADIDDRTAARWAPRQLLEGVDVLAHDRNERFEAAVDEVPEPSFTAVDETEETGKDDHPELFIKRGADRERLDRVADSARAAGTSVARVRPRETDDQQLWEEAVLDGERIVAIPREAFSEHARVPETGRWIDIVATVWLDEGGELADPEKPGQSAAPATWTVLQRAAIVANDGRTIAVSATPDEAHLLAHLTDHARLRPAIRPVGERDTDPVERRHLRGILEEFADIESGVICCPLPDGGPSEEVEIIR